MKWAARMATIVFGLLPFLLFTSVHAKCILSFDIVPDLSVWKLGGSARVYGRTTFDMNQTTPQSGMSFVFEIFVSNSMHDFVCNTERDAGPDCREVSLFFHTISCDFLISPFAWPL
jgi:hypothetical protein